MASWKIIYISVPHNQYSWWRHQMRHFSREWPFVRGIHRWPVNSPHKGQWRGALMFSLICAWINGWINNHEVGDLRRHQSHYDVTVMWRWVFYGAMNQVISSHSIELVLWKHLGVGAKRVDIEICTTKLEGGWWDSPQERLHNFIYDYFESTYTEIIQYTSNVF